MITDGRIFMIVTCIGFIIRIILLLLPFILLVSAIIGKRQKTVCFVLSGILLVNSLLMLFSGCYYGNMFSYDDTKINALLANVTSLDLPFEGSENCYIYDENGSQIAEIKNVKVAQQEELLDKDTKFVLNRASNSGTTSSGVKYIFSGVWRNPGFLYNDNSYVGCVILMNEQECYYISYVVSFHQKSFLNQVAYSPLTNRTAISLDELTDLVK